MYQIYKHIKLITNPFNYTCSKIEYEFLNSIRIYKNEGSQTTFEIIVVFDLIRIPGEGDLPFGRIWVLLTGSWVGGTVKQPDCLSTASYRLSVETNLEPIAGSNLAANR